MQLAEVTLRDNITLVLAIIGTVLGILNWLRSRRRDQEQLRVVPGRYIDPITPTSLYIDVINHGVIDVTVREIGFKLRTKPAGKMVLSSPTFRDGGKLPKRLAPKTSFSVCFPYSENHEVLYAKIKVAYAETETGAVFSGTSHALRGFVKKARSRHSS